MELKVNVSLIGAGGNGKASTKELGSAFLTALRETVRGSRSFAGSLKIQLWASVKQFAYFHETYKQNRINPFDWMVPFQGAGVGFKGV